MNDQTKTLITRPYQEIVDDILTAIVGGVVNEPILFDVKDDRYPLAEPASDVRTITGTRTPSGGLGSEAYTFLKGVDFEFSQADNQVVWMPAGQRPDDETSFYVDYIRRDARPLLTDINVGSVTRTLSEAIGREIATVYQQINRAYLSGFVDTAEGQALDLVVAILGVARKTKDHAEGIVTFRRDTAAADGNISIPEGTRLTTAKGDKTFVTSQLRTLQRGQVRIDAPVRAAEESKGPDGLVPAGAITTLAQPITGIASVTNLEPTALGAGDETDDELRARARAALRSLGSATLAALIRVVGERRATLVQVMDPNLLDNRTNPGEVTLIVETEPERFRHLIEGIEETRAAGVRATVVARYIYVTPRLRVRITAGLTPEGKVKVTDQIIEAMQRYVDGLTAGDALKGDELLRAIRSVGDVQEATMVDVLPRQADVGRRGADALLDALMAAIASVPADDATARRAALARALSESAPTPSGAALPNRDLVKGPSGERATDDEIEAGTFQVEATIGGERWWIVLALEHADIALVES